MLRFQKGFTAVEAAIAVVVVCMLGTAAGSLYVAVHFLSKIW